MLSSGQGQTMPKRGYPTRADCMAIVSLGRDGRRVRTIITARRLGKHSQTCWKQHVRSYDAAMAATTILRPALLTRRTTAPSEADNAKPRSKRRRPAGCSGLILRLLIRRYTGLHEDKSEHVEGIEYAQLLYMSIVSTTSVPFWFLRHPFTLRACTTITHPLKTPVTPSGSSAN